MILTPSMIRRYLEMMDRGNPLRGRRPLYVFFLTLATYAGWIGLTALVNRDADDSTWIGGFIGFTAVWFVWVWRA